MTKGYIAFYEVLPSVFLWYKHTHTHVAWFVLNTPLTQQSELLFSMVTLTFRESVWQEHSVLSTNAVQLKEACAQSQRHMPETKEAAWVGILTTCKWQELKLYTDSYTVSIAPLLLVTYLTPAPNSLISSWFHLWRRDRVSPLHALSIKDFNSGKNVQFTTWGLSLPQKSRLLWGLGPVRGSCPPDAVPRFPLLAIICSHSASLPSIWQMQVWSCPPSNPLKERKQKPKQRLDICIRKENIVGTHHTSESLPISQVG